MGKIIQFKSTWDKNFQIWNIYLIHSGITQGSAMVKLPFFDLPCIKELMVRLFLGNNPKLRIYLVFLVKDCPW